MRTDARIRHANKDTTEYHKLDLQPAAQGRHKYDKCQPQYEEVHAFLANKKWAFAQPESEAAGITLTPKAIQMAKQKVADAGAPVEGLRLGVKGGGCSGYYYVYDFATKIRPNKDLVFEFELLRLRVDT